MKSRTNKWLPLFLIATMMISTLHISCKTNKTAAGAVIGTAVGGTTGLLLSKKNKAVGFIIGAAVGGLAGGLIGSYMDKHAKDIADDLGKDATVTRVGEGIVVSFDSGLMFDVDSDALRGSTRTNLDRLSESLNKYPDTNVRILGHTDSTGSSAYNQTLSQKRAASVKTFLTTQNVSDLRIRTEGFGENDPVSTNETEEGRQFNRRVEIVIVANDQLKKKAKEGTL